MPPRTVVKRALRSEISRVRYGRNVGLLSSLSLFAPNSSGSHRARAELTIQSAQQTFPLLEQLLMVSRGQALPRIDAETLCPDEESKQAAQELAELFRANGSDKSTGHNYHYIYGPILKDRLAVTGVLEIGLGTNNRDVVSNMKGNGRPGASLRAFRDFLPNAEIFGADFDRSILFTDERIRTFFVDQTETSSFSELDENVHPELDLIIDDGLHSPNANIAVLIFALDRLKAGGSLVIEDIAASALPLWQVVASLLPTEFQPRLIDAKGAKVFAVERQMRVQ